MPERCRIAGEWMAPARQDAPRASRAACSSRRRSAPARRSHARGCPRTAARSTRALPTIVQVGAAARRLEIAVVGRDAHAGAAVDRVGRDAGALGRVVVVAPAVAEARAASHQGAIDSAPVLDRRAIDRDRAAVAVVGRVAEIDVGLELVEIRQHIRSSPSPRSRPRAQRSKSSGTPRMAIWPLMVELPPTARPRHSSFGSCRSVRRASSFGQR